MPSTCQKTDVSKAHRRIKLKRKDWRHGAAAVGDEFWINKCGIYGIASAQWYWGRMAALLLRLTHAILESPLWHFVYVDDFIFLLDSEHQ